MASLRDSDRRPTHPGAIFQAVGDRVEYGGLCCIAKRNFPARKHEHSGMTLEGTSKNLGALNAQIYPSVLNG